MFTGILDKLLYKYIGGRIGICYDTRKFRILILKIERTDKKMNTVEKLLKIDAGTIKNPTKTVKMKLKKLGGQEFDFECEAVSPELYAEIQEDAVKMKKGDIKKIDMYPMKCRTILEGCKLFKDKDLRDHFKAASPKELISKLLVAGEIDDLYNEIVVLSGYEKDDEEEEEEIKNL